MARYLCQDDPHSLAVEAKVLDARPGAVLLDRTSAYPGGGGQLANKAKLSWEGRQVDLIGFEADPRGCWHLFDGDHSINSDVVVDVNRPFGELMCELHTVSHIVNNIVFHHFGGALVTGVQMSDDGSFRIDFDIPGADNERLKSLEPEINDAIRQDFSIRQHYIPMAEAEAERGVIRSKAVAPPPQEDGPVRIVELDGFDRQACGGTHLMHTGLARPVRILKIDNKGRQNRRLRVGIADLFQN